MVVIFDIDICKTCKRGALSGYFDKYLSCMTNNNAPTRGLGKLVGGLAVHGSEMYHTWIGASPSSRLMGYRTNVQASTTRGCRGIAERCWCGYVVARNGWLGRIR